LTEHAVRTRKVSIKRYMLPKAATDTLAFNCQRS